MRQDSGFSRGCCVRRLHRAALFMLAVGAPLARVSAQDGGTVVGVVVHATSQLAIESARLEVEEPACVR
ncbi:MAG: hypothetical protein IPP90_15895 [Gemmatimonadaceae bacterium]|nr:hypothetical protein [Gemmatimonadaceae bacterium]